MLTLAGMVGSFMYVKKAKSQEEAVAEKEEEPKKPAEPVATASQVVSDLLKLKEILVQLQRDIAGNKEDLAKISAHWKRKNEPQYVESFEKTNKGIQELLSALLITLSSRKSVEEMRRSAAALNIIKSLAKKPPVNPREKAAKQILRHMSQIGRALFVDKLLEKFKTQSIEPKPEEKQESSFDQAYEQPYDQTFDDSFMFTDFDNYDFGAMDFGEFDNYDFGEFSDEFFGDFGGF